MAPQTCPLCGVTYFLSPVATSTLPAHVCKAKREAVARGFEMEVESRNRLQAQLTPPPDLVTRVRISTQGTGIAVEWIVDPGPPIRRIIKVTDQNMPAEHAIQNRELNHLEDWKGAALELGLIPR